MTKPAGRAAAHGICDVDSAAAMIKAGRVLVLAGEEAMLAQLPAGQWIGGTVAHFLTPDGGVPASGRICYTDFTAIAETATLRGFTVGDIHEIAQGYPENGFAILILPGFSPLLHRAKAKMMDYDRLYNVPLMGWVSGVELDALPGELPKCFTGGPDARHDQAAVMYIRLPAALFAHLHIVNMFSPGDGPEIRFLGTGQMTDGACLIDGQPANLAQYMAQAGIDPRLPLMADRDGALLNVSVLKADAQTGEITLLSPVCPVRPYRFAAAVVDYPAEFIQAMQELDHMQVAHICVCLMNFTYAGLQQPQGLNFTAPVTFGQIGYTILNQTVACLGIGRNEEFAAEPE